MSYATCCKAQEEIRKRCDSTKPEYEKCVHDLGIVRRPSDVKGCVPSTCIMDGTSTPQYTCLTDESKVPQTCGGNYVHGIPSKVTR